MLERINFPKIVTVLAVTFGIALGSCGITAVLAMSGVPVNQGFASVLMILGYLELAAMILSAIGLVLVAVLWVIAGVMGKVAHKDPDIVRLFDQKEEKHDDPR